MVNSTKHMTVDEREGIIADLEHEMIQWEAGQRSTINFISTAEGSTAAVAVADPLNMIAYACAIIALKMEL